MMSMDVIWSSFCNDDHGRYLMTMDIMKNSMIIILVMMTMVIIWSSFYPCFCMEDDQAHFANDDHDDHGHHPLNDDHGHGGLPTMQKMTTTMK